jgi:hypothetical protein
MNYSLPEKCPHPKRKYIESPWSRNLHWGCPPNNQGNFVGAKVVAMRLKYQ